MSDSKFDDELVRNLPNPLAQLYRRAHNAKNPLDRHLTAFDLWEVSLKLLGSAAVVAYSEHGNPKPEVAEALNRLARPTLGDWWRFIRLLLPVLSETGDEGFRAAHDALFGRARDDLPRAAGLDAILREILEGSSGARTTVRLGALFERLVTYRNRVLAHGAPGQRPAEFHDRMGRALLAGFSELLSRLDVLVGRRLIYVADVSRQPSGAWVVEQYELTGEVHRRLEPRVLAGSDEGRLPTPGRVYLHLGPLDAPDAAALMAIHPLLVYDPDAGETLFLNARRGKRRGVYLGYSSGRESERPDLSSDHRALLAQILGMEVDTAQVERWVADSVAEDGESGPPLVGAASRTLGEFELLSKLGQGGMGIVYRAWQPSVGRQVALKRLLLAGDARAEARFAREIRALGRVDHPNLVKIYTSGSQGDEWFYAMELVEGPTLDAVVAALQAGKATFPGLDIAVWRESIRRAYEQSRLAEKPFSGTDPESLLLTRVGVDAPGDLLPVTGCYIDHVVLLVLQVCEAAHALHEAKVVHRDIKPGNIAISPDGSQAVLMDLGLAQLADELDGKLTRTRQFVGTLRYASPEQVLAVDRLDRRSDVYSLGALLWELLTLQTLYGASEQTPSPELMKRIQYTEPEHPRKFNPGVPSDLEAIVLRCLEKNPSRRYETARGLAEDLGRWIDGEPVKARRRTLGYVLGKSLRRNRAKVGLALALIMFQAAVVASLYFYLRPVPARPQAGPEATAPSASPSRPPLPLEAKSTDGEVSSPGAELVTTATNVPLKVLVRKDTFLRGIPDRTEPGEIAKAFEFFYVTTPKRSKPSNPPTRNGFYGVSTARSVLSMAGWIASEDVVEWPHRLALGLKPIAGRKPALFYRSIDDIKAVYQGDATRIPLSKEPPLGAGQSLMPMLGEFKLRGPSGDEITGYRVAYLHQKAGAAGAAASKVDLKAATLDIVFVIDTTSGMQPHINAVKEAVRRVAESFRDDPTNRVPVRFGLVGYRDRIAKPDPSWYVTKVFWDLDRTAETSTGKGTRIDEFLKVFDTVTAAPAVDDDVPEDMLGGLREAVKLPSWDPNAFKHIILIGDASGHVESDDPKNPEKLSIQGIRAMMQPPYRESLNSKIICHAFRIVGEDVSDNPHAEEHFARLAEGIDYPGLNATFEKGNTADLVEKLVSLIEKSREGLDKVMKGGNAPANSAEPYAGTPSLGLLLEMVAAGVPGEGEVPTFASGYVAECDLDGKEQVEPYLLVQYGQFQTFQSVINLSVNAVRSAGEPGGRDVEKILQTLQIACTQLGINEPIKPDLPLHVIFSYLLGFPVRGDIFAVTPQILADMTQEDFDQWTKRMEACNSIIRGYLENSNLWKQLGRDSRPDTREGFLRISELP